MVVNILIPSVLKQYTNGNQTIGVQAETVREAMEALNSKYPSIRKHLYDEGRKLRNFINIFVNEEDIRSIRMEETPVKDGDTIIIIPAVAGGAPQLS